MNDIASLWFGLKSLARHQPDYIWAALGIVFFVLGIYLLVKALAPKKDEEQDLETEYAAVWENTERPTRSEQPAKGRRRTFCPYCDEPISINAIRCPWCRSDLKGEEPDQETRILGERRKAEKRVALSEDAPRVTLDLSGLEPEVLQNIMAALKRPARRPWVKLTLACLAAAVWLLLLAVALAFAKEKTLGVRVLVWVGLLAGMLAAAYAYILGYERGLCKVWESEAAAPQGAGAPAPGSTDVSEVAAPEPEPAAGQAPKPRVVGLSLWERVTGSPWAWLVLVGLSLLCLLVAGALHVALKARGIG